ncbi:hypothetical protein C0992_005023 [Termitomyces sp. T32_za158]|nr:hypothetical protein C0992_005023 [Termitomyces sp. T32_za158]
MSYNHSRCGASLLLSLRRKGEKPLLLGSIDNIFERPLLSFYNPLLDDAPDVHIDFALVGPHYSVIEVDHTFLDLKHRPRRIDDELVMRMKRPIDLPDEDYQSDYSTNDNSGLVDATSAISLTSFHQLPSPPRGKHRERAPAPDAHHGSARCSAAYITEPPDTPRRSRSFGHSRH